MYTATMCKLQDEKTKSEATPITLNILKYLSSLPRQN